MGSDFMKTGVSGISPESRPRKRTCTAPGSTPTRSSSDFSVIPVHKALPIRSERFHEDGRFRHFARIETAKAHLYRTGQHAHAIEQRFQRNPGPQGVAHRAVAPFPARYARRREAATVARTLVHGSKLELVGSVQNFLERVLGGR